MAAGAGTGGPEDGGGSRPRRRRGWRRALLVVLPLAVIGVGASAGLAGRADPPARVTLGAGTDSTEPSTSTSEPPAPTTTTEEAATTTSTTPTTSPAPAPTAPPPAGAARLLLSDPSGRWKLSIHDDTRCLDLELAEAAFRSLLCGAAPSGPDGALGAVAAVDSPIGRLLVVVARPDITALDVSPRAGGRFFQGSPVAVDASHRELAYSVAPAERGWVEVRAWSGPHAVARGLVPSEDRAYRPDEIVETTKPPYGVWSGFRRAGYTGLFFGGEQFVGFYDGADGRPCALYRRLGGEYEAVLADGCATAGSHLPYAALSPAPPEPGSPTRRFVVLAMTDTDADRLQLVLDDGSTVATQATPMADPNGTGWRAFVENIAVVTLPSSTTRATFVLSRAGVEVARLAVAVPPAA